MKIILTGASGMIGSRFEELMSKNHEIIRLSSDDGVDITDKDSVAKFIEGRSYDAVIHMAGKTDVDGCETDKIIDLGILKVEEENVGSLDIGSLNASEWKGVSTAVAVNSIGTKNLYDVVKKENVKFIYISSDFVFSGNDKYYDEESKPNPVDWYGMSKYLGEKVVDSASDLIVRIAFPYGYLSPVKKDFVWKLHDLLETHEQVSIVSDQTITPTFIDDVVMGLDFLLQNQTSGIVNVVGGSSHTPKAISEKIKQTYGFTTVINDANLASLYAGKAPRPFQSIMRNDKLADLGFVTKTFDEGLALISSR